MRHMTVYGTRLGHIPFLSSIFDLVLKDFEARGFILLFLFVFPAQQTDPLKNQQFGTITGTQLVKYQSTIGAVRRVG